MPGAPSLRRTATHARHRTSLRKNLVSQRVEPTSGIGLGRPVQHMLQGFPPRLAAAQGETNREATAFCTAPAARPERGRDVRANWASIGPSSPLHFPGHVINCIQFAGKGREVISGPHRYPLRAADLAVADNCLRPAALGFPTFRRPRGPAPRTAARIWSVSSTMGPWPSSCITRRSLYSPADALRKALERDGTTIIEPPNNAREDALLTRDPASTPVQLLDTEQAKPRLVRPKCHR